MTLLLDYERFQRLEALGLSPYTTHLDNEVLNYVESIDLLENPYLRTRNQVVQLVEAIDHVYTRRNILFCIDVEAWERNTNLVTELGISIYDPRGQGLSLYPNISTYHIIIKETADKRNGRYVADHMDNYNGGVSYLMAQLEAVKFVKSLIDYYFAPRKDIGCCLVGHDVKGDSNWFHSIGIDIPNVSYVIDTNKIYALSHGRQGGSLTNLLKLVNIPNAFLHNAANDAYYTLLVAMRLCDPHVRELFQLDRGIVLNANKSTAKAQSKRSKLRNANKSDIVDYHSCSELLHDLYQSPKFAEHHDNDNDDDNYN